MRMRDYKYSFIEDPRYPGVYRTAINIYYAIYFSDRTCELFETLPSGERISLGVMTDALRGRLFDYRKAAGRDSAGYDIRLGEFSEESLKDYFATGRWLFDL